MTPREKYLKDPHYKVLVDRMVQAIRECEYSPSELREAAILASTIYEMEHARRAFCAYHNFGGEWALCTCERKDKEMP